VNLAQEGDEILQRAPKPIDAPGHDDVKPTASRIPTQAVEGGALVATLGAADAVVRINLDDLVAQARSHRPKFLLLIVGGLVERGRAQVKSGSHQALFGLETTSFQVHLCRDCKPLICIIVRRKILSGFLRRPPTPPNVSPQSRFL
jgi:hypothetical protein